MSNEHECGVGKKRKVGSYLLQISDAVLLLYKKPEFTTLQTKKEIACGAVYKIQNTEFGICLIKHCPFSLLRIIYHVGFTHEIRR